MVRRVFLTILLLVCGFVAAAVRADTFNLVNGETITGEVLASSANDAGAQIKVGEGEYKRISWASFSQEDLKKLAAIPKLQAYVEPFIIASPEERIKKTEVKLKPPARLEQPRHMSLIGALFSSGPGFLIVLLLFAANLYAAYEVSIFRAQPAGLVCGVSAILPIAGPIIFLSMRTKTRTAEQPWEPEPAAAPAAETTDQAAPAADALNPMQAEGAAHPTGLKLAHTETPKEASALPAETKYQRGQFTFNRRFIETKFGGFFGVVRRDAERDMVLVVKSARGEYIGQRISRIAANDFHLQIQRAGASEEVMIPFQDIQQIVVRHKDAK
ncbi:MAG TPA: hypothetical protein VMU04_20305 [Candidatus Acidoferrum sp.]|nr:hypothetical protein [Candidatus Acidoferrum sp.]